MRPLAALRRAVTPPIARRTGAAVLALAAGAGAWFTLASRGGEPVAQPPALTAGGSVWVTGQPGPAADPRFAALLARARAEGERRTRVRIAARSAADQRRSERQRAQRRRLLARARGEQRAARARYLAARRRAERERARALARRQVALAERERALRRRARAIARRRAALAERERRLRVQPGRECDLETVREQYLCEAGRVPGA